MNLDGGAGGGSGVFTSDGTTTTTIAHSSSPIFQTFRDSPSINASGTLAFQSGLDQFGVEGIFTEDGATTTEVIRTGSPLFGSTVIGLGMSRQTLNDAGQVGFFYALDNGVEGVAVATPVPATGCPTCPGDMDGNLRIDGDDLKQFITCAIAAAGGAPTPTCECADVVADSFIDSQDVEQFVSLLLSPPTCP